jgi:hypothetical protein
MKYEFTSFSSIGKIIFSYTAQYSKYEKDTIQFICHGVNFNRYASFSSRSR